MVTSVAGKRTVGIALSLALCTAWFFPSVPAWAREREPDWELRAFALAPRAQRNRVPAEELTEVVQTGLLKALNAGIRGCECLPRRLRWVWSLPNPKDAVHPALVVSFEDRPRESTEILMYERLALIAYQDGKYVAAGVLTLNRPRANVKASLNVRMLPRRDFDQDGQLDIAIGFAETWQEVTECGRVLFQSSAAQPSFERVICPATMHPIEATVRHEHDR